MDDPFTRVFENLVGRITGPMQFRLILQPTVAILLAVRAGVHDARSGRPPYLWSVFTDSTHRGARLREGWASIARVFVVAVVLDGVYQFIQLRWFYPGEALIVAFILACIPYLLVRGTTNRLVRGRRPVAPVVDHRD